MYGVGVRPMGCAVFLAALVLPPLGLAAFVSMYEPDWLTKTPVLFESRWRLFAAAWIGAVVFGGIGLGASAVLKLLGLIRPSDSTPTLEVRAEEIPRYLVGLEMGEMSDCLVVSQESEFMLGIARLKEDKYGVSVALPEGKLDVGDLRQTLSPFGVLSELPDLSVSGSDSDSEFVSTWIGMINLDCTSFPDVVQAVKLILDEFAHDDSVLTTYFSEKPHGDILYEKIRESF